MLAGLQIDIAPDQPVPFQYVPHCSSADPAARTSFRPLPSIDRPAAAPLAPSGFDARPMVSARRSETNGRACIPVVVPSLTKDREDNVRRVATRIGGCCPVVVPVMLLPAKAR